MNTIKIDYQKCKKDGICAAVCPRKLFLLDEKNRPTLSDNAEDTCINCGHCLSACPTGAISINKTTAENCNEIIRNLWPMYENLDHLMRSRRSIRAYSSKKVEPNAIENLLETVRYAPTGSNGQGVEWIGICEPAKVKKLGQLVIDWFKECIETSHPLAEKLPMAGIITAWENNMDMVFRGAPSVILNHQADDKGLPAENCAIAMTYLELLSASQGLGSCWAGFLMIAASLNKDIRKNLGIPEGNSPGSALMLGYPKYKHKRVPPRNPVKLSWW